MSSPLAINHVTRAWRMSRLLAATCTVMLVLQGCPPPTPPPPSPAAPANACFVQATGVPYNNAPPTVDGVIAGDLGWTRSFGYVADNSSSVPDVMVQGIRDDASKSFLLAFEVNNDYSFDDKDAIVLGFSPDTAASNSGTTTDDRLIVIYPVWSGVGQGAAVGAGPGAAPRQVKYWAGGTAAWSATGAPVVLDPAWLVDNIRVTSQSSGATTNHWYVEVRIPITATASTGQAGQAADTGIDLPMGKAFGLWMDVLRVKNVSGSLSGIEFKWPVGIGLTGTSILTPQKNSPAVSTWGKGILGDASLCNGVNFASYDIRVDHPAAPMLGSTDIALNQPNTFKVDVHNDAVNSAGTYIQSDGVQATFQIANWGIPGATGWNQIVVGDNPTLRANIPAAAGVVQGSATLQTQPWSLTAAESTNYAASPHQCVRVELNSNITTTTFKVRSTWNNMDFRMAASPFTDTATVSLQGYKPAPGEQQIEYLLTTHTFNTPRDAKWQESVRGLEQRGPSLYSLRGGPETTARVASQVLAPDLALPTRDVALPANAGADRTGVSIPARPGSLITLIAEGTIQLRGDAKTGLSGPDGISLKSEQGKYVLDQRLSPDKRVGAVIGSWDNFKASSFVVGRAATFRVPSNTDALYLAINDTPEGFRQHRGDGFRVQAVQTPVERYHTFWNSRVLRDPQFEAVRLPTGANMPMWIVCGEIKTGRKVDLDGQVFELYDRTGCYGAIVRKGRPQR